MATGDRVFYRQKRYTVIDTTASGWLLIKRSIYPPFWIHETSAMLVPTG